MDVRRILHMSAVSRFANIIKTNIGNFLGIKKKLFSKKKMYGKYFPRTKEGKLTNSYVPTTFFALTLISSAFRLVTSTVHSFI